MFEMAVHDESADNGPNYKSDVELWNEVKVYKDFNDEGNHYICRGCKNYLLYERFPPNSHKNKLDLYNIYKHDDTLFGRSESCYDSIEHCISKDCLLYTSPSPRD